jgi:hypothetical protein
MFEMILPNDGDLFKDLYLKVISERKRNTNNT